MPKLYVVRHAEPTITGRLLGRTDPPLSAAGLERARRKLGPLQVEMVYTSPLRRAKETAAVIPAPQRVLDDLAEIGLGEWDGLTWIEVEARYPELARRKSENWFGVTPPGGEAWPEFEQRVNRALDEIFDGPLPAAVVTHVAVNAVLARELGSADIASFKQELCEIKEYDLHSTEAAD